MTNLLKYSFPDATSVSVVNCPGAVGHEIDGVVGVTIAFYRNATSISIGCPGLSDSGRCSKGGFITAANCIHIEPKMFRSNS